MKLSTKSTIATLGIIALVSGSVGLVVTASNSYKKSLKESNELNICYNSTPRTMDPTMVTDISSSNFLQLCTGYLYNIYEGSEPVPELAESYDLSEDGLTYTFHLRDDINYHNGIPRTAEDFVYAFQRLADPDTGSQAVFYITDAVKIKNAYEINMGEKPVQELGVYAPDSQTFVVELESLCPYFISLIANTCFAPLNEEFMKSVGDNYGTSPETILSSGPFYPDRYIPHDTQIHYNKNPYYFNSENVKLSGVSIQIATDYQQTMMSYEAGAFDIIMASGETIDLVVNDQNLNTVGSGNAYMILPNHEKVPALANRNIRIALSKSINREDIVKYVLKTGHFSLYSLTPPNFALNPDGSDFCNAKVDYYEYCGYDPDKAREYFEKGLKELGISSLKLEMTTTKANLTESIVDSMEKTLPGLDIEINVVSSSQLRSKWTSGEYEMIDLNWYADYPDPHSMLSSLSANSYTNKSGWYNEEYERILFENCSEKDTVKRTEMLHKAEDIIMQDAAFIPLYYIGSNWMIKDNIKGVTFSYLGTFPKFTYAEKN